MHLSLADEKDVSFKKKPSWAPWGKKPESPSKSSGL